MSRKSEDEGGGGGAGEGGAEGAVDAGGVRSTGRGAMKGMARVEVRDWMASKKEGGMKSGEERVGGGGRRVEKWTKER